MESDEVWKCFWSSWSWLTTEMHACEFHAEKISLTVCSSVVTFRSSSCICRPTSLLYNTIMKYSAREFITETETVWVYIWVPSWPGGGCPRCSETGAGWRWWYRSHWASCDPGSPVWSALAALTSTATQTGPYAPSLKTKEKRFTRSSFTSCWHGAVRTFGCRWSGSCTFWFSGWTSRWVFPKSVHTQPRSLPDDVDNR